VFFTVRHGDESICLSRDEGDFPLRNQVQKPGDRFPLGVGAGSCAMLAALADADITDVLARSAALRAEHFPRCTDDAVWRMVAGARERGALRGAGQPDDAGQQGDHRARSQGKAPVHN
jgi:DNA-binding IclR family transcriptional regulator